MLRVETTWFLVVNKVLTKSDRVSNGGLVEVVEVVVGAVVVAVFFFLLLFRFIFLPSSTPPEQRNRTV